MRTFTYDNHARLLTRTTPEQGTTTYGYNLDDTVQTITDARNALMTFSYNPRKLRLPPSRYARTEISRLPETPNPPKVWIYTDEGNGISIRTQADSGSRTEELVVSITYSPAQADHKLRCKSRNN